MEEGGRWQRGNFEVREDPERWMKRRERGRGGRVELGDPRFTEMLVVLLTLVVLSSLSVEWVTPMDPKIGFQVWQADLKGNKQETY